MPYVIGLLIIIVCILYPPLFVFGAILLIIGLIIGLVVVLGPFIAVLGGILVIFIAYFLFGLENDVLQSVESRQGLAKVSEVLVDKGVAVSDRDDCKFATCRVYNAIENLIDDGDLSVAGSVQTVHSSNQILLLPKKEN
jgi:hypothetical protein